MALSHLRVSLRHERFYRALGENEKAHRQNLYIYKLAWASLAAHRNNINHHSHVRDLWHRWYWIIEETWIFKKTHLKLGELQDQRRKQNKQMVIRQKRESINIYLYGLKKDKITAMNRCVSYWRAWPILFYLQQIFMPSNIDCNNNKTSLKHL